MNYSFKYSLFIFPFILSACSGPPKPQSVEWNSNSELLNSTLPEWKSSGAVNAAAQVDGKWVKTIKDVDINKPVSLGVYYAMAHSTRIVVKTSSSQQWFDTKAWLRSHGANGVIDFEYAKDCITCNTVDVSFSRGMPVVLAQGKPAPHKGTAKPVITLPPKGGVIKRNDVTASTGRQALPASTSTVVMPVTGKNPFGQKSSPVMHVIPKVTTAKPAPKGVGPVPVVMPLVNVKPVLPVWRADVGSTLHRVLLKWSGEVPCNITGKWTINWNSSKDYSIDSALTFRGEYIDAVTRLFNLYKKANSPLFIDVYQTQCLIIVSDASETKK